MPNETQNRSEKAHRRTTSGASRRIATRGDSGPVDMSTMSFLPIGLQWRRRSSITLRQFFVERDARVASKGKQAWSNLQLGINVHYVLSFIYWFRPFCKHFGAHNLSHILKIML